MLRVPQSRAVFMPSQLASPDQTPTAASVLFPESRRHYQGGKHELEQLANKNSVS
jgi:hypothetical protein